MKQKMKSFRYAKQIIIGVLVVAIIALVICLFPKKITHFVSLDSLTMVYITTDDYQPKICEVLNKNDLSQLFINIRCFRAEPISFVSPGDIGIEYGDYCIVISHDKQYMYSTATGATYVFVGNHKDLYQKVSILINLE